MRIYLECENEDNSRVVKKGGNKYLKLVLSLKNKRQYRLFYHKSGHLQVKNPDGKVILDTEYKGENHPDSPHCKT